MEEKKKWKRPTVAQVRALESEIRELREQLRIAQRENAYSEEDGRDAARLLSEERQKNDHLRDSLEVMKKNDAYLAQQVYDARKELIKAQNECGDYYARWQEVSRENEMLRGRSLWKRILNK